jgi:serine/threonine-protein kinase RsbW
VSDGLSVVMGHPDGLTLSANPDIVELEIPADRTFFGMVRTAAAALAARLNLTIDRIEDLQIAVDEACTLLMPAARVLPQQATATPSPTIGAIACQFIVDRGVLQVEVSGPAVVLPQPDDTGWAVLSALVDRLECGQRAGRAGVTPCQSQTFIQLSMCGPSGTWS